MRWAGGVTGQGWEQQEEEVIMSCKTCTQMEERQNVSVSEPITWKGGSRREVIQKHVIAALKESGRQGAWAGTGEVGVGGEPCWLSTRSFSSTCTKIARKGCSFMCTCLRFLWERKVWCLHFQSSLFQPNQPLKWLPHLPLPAYSGKGAWKGFRLGDI